MVTLSRREGVVQREVAGEVFLVPIRGRLADLQELFVLNETGRWIWERLEGECPVGDLVSGMMAEFEVDEATAVHDVEVFAGNLVEAGLAKTTDGEV
jgi:hypothetical protein